MLSDKNSTSRVVALGPLSARTKQELLGKANSSAAIGKQQEVNRRGSINESSFVEEPKICFGEEFFIPPRQK